MDLKSAFLAAGYPGDNLRQLGYKPVHGKTIGKVKRLLESGDHTGAVDLLKANLLAHPLEQSLGDLRAPAQANVIAISNSVEDWSVSKFSSALQSAVYNLKYEKYLVLSKTEIRKAPIVQAVQALGLEVPDTIAQQTMNAIFLHAVNTYNGVIEKAKNKAVKERQKRFADELWKKYRKEAFLSTDDGRVVLKEKVKAEIRAENKRITVEEKGGMSADVAAEVFEDGKLKHPPGPNPTLPLTESTSLRPLKATDVDILLALNLSEGPDSPKVRIMTLTELLCSKQEVRDHRSIGRRNVDRKGVGKPLYCVVRMCGEWLVADARGLLRQAKRWFPETRTKGLSLDGLLDLFTTDGSIYFNQKENRLQVKLIFKPGSLPVTMATVKHQSIKRFQELDHEAVILGIDVGVVHPITAVTVPISPGCKAPVADPDVFQPAVNQTHLKYVQQRSTELRESLHKQAVASLSEEDREEIQAFEGRRPEVAKSKLREILGEAISQESWDALPWNKMGTSTHLIWDALVTKNAAAKPIWDSRFAKDSAQPLSKEIRDRLSDAEYTAQRGSREFRSIQTHVSNKANQMVNDAVAWAKEKYPTREIYIAIEDLLQNKFMDGKGGRAKDSGWNGFFVAKEDRRWFKFMGVYKSLVDRAQNKGANVIKVDPRYTSQCCLACGYTSRDNRLSQSDFVCRKCAFTTNADVVGATNIARVCFTGKSIKKIERSSDDKKAAPARTRKAPKPKGKLKNAHENDLTLLAAA